ncbi:GGDEF domain-containing protein [Pseudomonas sp. 8AS]|uniref:GGDEF domain-containing protein n=1 Tax=Pseudomonas sp. 8AS TaxID=2653163 RepID=UPI0012EFA051|nr:GGDEF domain-containing protein [Pseudomonas sp. 8AS]VXB60488.1 GGDEF domain-containing protein [Pseudomonas sp. 8AS]
MLQLHIPTLLLANASVVILCGLLMLFSWWRGRHERTLLWGGGMLLLAAVGLVLNSLRGMGLDWLSIILGNMVLQFCVAMNWAAVRAFCGRATAWPWMFLGSLLWLLLCLWPAFYGEIRWRLLAYTLLMTLYMLASMTELWRSRHVLGVSSLPALLLMGAHSLFYLIRMLVDPAPSSAAGAAPSPLFAMLLVESMLYAVGIAFLLLSMVKERAEQQYRAAAYSDPLTGIGNRRAFLSAGERLLRLCAEQHQPVALLLCDLDHFKAINDRYGHSAGDLVLQQFSAGVALQLRKSDVFGRIGGEEFACLLVGTQADALALAERIRLAFAAAAPAQRPQSVSIGVASSLQAGYDLTRLLSLADQALYQAKGGGRNRVQAYAEAGQALPS